MIADDDDWVRLSALRIDLWSTAPRQAVLHALIASHDESALIKAAAVDLLSTSDPSMLRLFEEMSARHLTTSHEQVLFGKLLEKINKSNPEIVDAFLQKEGAWQFPAEVLTSICAQRSVRNELVAKRIMELHHSAETELEAAKAMPLLLSSVQALLQRSHNDPARWFSIVLALRALPKNDSATRPERLKLLESAHIASPDNDSQRKRRSLRYAAIESFAGDAAALELVTPFLVAEANDLCAASLNVVGHEHRIHELVWQLVDSGGHTVRHAAISVLAKCPHEQKRLLERLRSTMSGEAIFDDPRPAMAQALAPCLGESELTDLLKDSNEYVRLAAVNQLLQQKSSMSTLQSLAHTETSTVVQEVLWKEFVKNDKRLQDRLQSLTREDRSDVRHAYYLLLSNDATQLHVLRQHFEFLRSNDNSDHLLDLIPALARDRESLEALRSLLESKDVAVRASILRVLKGDGLLREAAHEKLRTVEGTSQLVVPWSGSVFLRYFAQDAKAKQQLTTQLQSEKFTSLTRITAQLLRGFEPAIPALRAHLDGPNQEEVEGALIDQLDVRGRVVARLKDPDRHVRRAAAEALQDVKEAQADLILLMNDVESDIRRIAQDAALRAKQEIPALLRAGRTEEKPAIRAAIVHGLSTMRTPEVQQFLRERVANDRAGVVRRTAAAALGSASCGVPLRSEGEMIRLAGADTSISKFLKLTTIL